MFALYHLVMPKVDQNNARRQGYLSLETNFKTLGAWARFFSSIPGIIIINAYLMACFHSPPLNSIRSMAQIEFVEKLALQLTTSTIGESSEDVEEASSSAAAELKPFDFAMQQKPMRCKSCGERSSIYCANCEETNCAVYWASEKKKRARKSNRPLEQARKRGCMAN